MTGLLITDPIRLENVLSSIKVIPGDTLFLRAGTYAGHWNIKIGGTEALPVSIRPYQNETVIIDGSLTFDAPHVKVYDFEIMDSNPDRTAVTPGITFNKPGCGLYGCLIHDLHSNGVNWFGEGPGEVAECVILNNGYKDAQGNNYAHAIYTHNNVGGLKTIARNVFFDSMGAYTIHVYSGGANYLKDYLIEDNLVCGDPVHTGGGLGLLDFTYRRNWQYGDYCQHGRYSGAYQNQNGDISNNVFIGLSSYSVNADCDFDWLNLVESDNQVYGGKPDNRAGYTYQAQPATLVQIVPFTHSARWLASLAIFNRDSAETVAVDFSNLLENGNYQLRNAQNPSETWQFEYTGESVLVPTAWTSAARVGDTTHPSTWPRFGAFVLERATT